MPIWSGSRSIWIRPTRDRHPPPVGEDLGEPAADGQHDIGVRQDNLRTDRTGMPQRERVALVEQALAVERGDHRCAEAAGQVFDRLGRARPECAAAGQNDRAFRLREDLGGLRDRDHPARPEVEAEERPASSAETSQDAAHQVLGEEQSRRSRPAPRHRLKGPAQQRRDAIDPTDRPAPGRRRAEDPLQVDLMVIAALAIHRVGIDLAGQQEDRDRIGPAFGDPAQGVGRAGARGRADHAGLARHPRRAVRREGAGLLVADQDRADRARPGESVVDRRGVRARHPEQVPHSPSHQSRLPECPRRLAWFLSSFVSDCDPWDSTRRRPPVRSPPSGIRRWLLSVRTASWCMMAGIGIAPQSSEGMIASMRQGLRRGEGGVDEIEESA